MSKQDPFLSRVRCGYSETSPSGYPYRVDEGGTEAFNRTDALVNLEGLSKDIIRAPNGVLPLDPYRLPFDSDLYSAQVAQSNFVDGDTSVNAGEIAEFIITNYTYTHAYTVSVIGDGSVELAEDKIIYKAPMVFTVGGDGFTIDGRTVLINVLGTASHAVSIPSILYPSNNASAVSINPTIVSSDFSYTGYPEVHLNTSWELTTDITFSSLVYSSYNDVDHKTTWVPGELMFDTPYYVRVRHTGGLSGTTEWSSVCAFTTRTESGVVQGDNYVNPPIILSETNTEGVLVPNRYVSVYKPSVIQYKDNIESVSLDPIIDSTVFGCEASIATEETIIREHVILLDDFSYTGAKQDYVSTIWEVSTRTSSNTLVELVQRLDSQTRVLSLVYLGDGIVLAGTYPSGKVYRSIDNGLSFTLVQELGNQSFVLSLVSLGNGIVLAATSGQVGEIYRSTDYGLSFTLVHQLEVDSIGVYSLIYLGNGVVLASGGSVCNIYRSIDNGLSFSLTQHLGDESYVFSFVSLGDGNVLAGTAYNGKIYRSTDNGLTFTLTQQLGNENEVDSLVYLGNGVVLAGTGYTGQIYRSTDNGLSFTLVQQLGSEEQIYSFISLGNGVVLAGTYPTGQVYKSVDNGVSFSLVQQLGNETDVYSLCYLGNGIALAGTSTGNVYRITYNDVSNTFFRTTDSTYRRKKLVLSNLNVDTTYYVRAKYVGDLTGESEWSTVFEFLTEPTYVKSDVTALDLDTNKDIIDPNGSVAYEFGSSIVVSADNQTLCVAQRDRHLQEIIINTPNFSFVQRLGNEINITSLLSLGNGIVLAGTYTTGQIYRSTDNGLSFTFVQRLATASCVFSLLSLGNGVVLAGTDNMGQVYRSTDNGLSFTLVQRLGSETYVETLLSLGDGIVLAGTGSTGQIYRSTDNGLSFTLVQRLGTETYVYSLLALGNGIVLAGTYGNSQIYRSTNNGLSFTLVQRLGSERHALSLLSLGNGIVLAGTNPTGQIYRSSDNGLSFTLVQRLGSQTNVFSLLSLGNGIVLAGSGNTGQIYRSTDYGLSFSLVQQLDNEQYAQTLLSLGNGTVLAGTYPTGRVYKNTGLVNETIYKLHAGSVSIFNRVNDAWEYSQNDLLLGDESSIYLGDDVSFNGDGAILAVSAPGKPVVGACNGVVYVLNKSNIPTVTHTLSAASYPEIQYFGDSISLNSAGTVLAIANRHTDEWDNNIYSVQLYTYTVDHWALSNTFNMNVIFDPLIKNTVKINGAGDCAYTAYFGIGESTYYFSRIQYDATNGWVQTDLRPELPSNSTLHRLSLSISNDETTAAVGVIVYYDSTQGQTYNGSTDIYRGYVDIFRRHVDADQTIVWYKETTIECTDTIYSPRFGYKVNLSSDGSDCAVTAQYLDPNDSTKVNAILLYKRYGNTYQQYHRVIGPDGKIGDDVAFAFNDDSIIYANNNGYKVQTLKLLKSDAQEHVETHWQMSTANDFSTVDYFAINKSYELTMWNTPQLNYNTTYYVRLKYVGHMTGESEWSAIKSFDTIRYAPPVYVEMRTLHPLYAELDYNQTYTNPLNYTYGTDLSLDGNGGTLVVGCPNKSTFFNTNSGAIYVYQGLYTVFNPTENIKTTLIEPNVEKFITTDAGNTTHEWSGICKLGNHVYACVYGGDIYKQTNGTGNFAPLSQGTRNWSGMCSNGTNVYACVYGGDIYKQANGTGSFVALSQGNRNWTGLCLLGNDIYACVDGGVIYKQTNGTGNFVTVTDTQLAWSDICVTNSTLYSCVNGGDVYKMLITDLPTENTLIPLNQTARNWYGFAVYGDDVYACVYGGDIYKQTNGVGDFVGIGQTARSWSSIAFLGDALYATTMGGDIYKQTIGIGTLTALGQGNRNWSGITVYGQNVYACVASGDIYKQTNGTGNFVALNQIARNWNGMCVLGADVYACSDDGIYKQTNGTGNFTLIASTARNWTGICPMGSDLFGTGFLQDIYRMVDAVGSYIPLGKTLLLYRGIVNYKNTLYIGVQNGDIYKMPFNLNNFESIGQITRNWFGITNHNGLLYACEYNDNIYKQNSVTKTFESLSQTSRCWTSMTSNGADVYACELSGNIYKQTSGSGNFISLGQTARSWYGMTSRGLDVYACVGHGDIYKQTGGSGNFIALNQTSRAWRAMTVFGNNVYACVESGDIYMQTNGTGDFLPLGQTSRNWAGMTASTKHIYAAVDSGDIYVQINATGNFVALGQKVKRWKNMTFLDNAVYIAAYGDNIYKLLESKYTFVQIPINRVGSLRSVATNGTQTYAAGLGAMDIYVLNPTTKIFERLNLPARSYYDIIFVGTNIYTCVNGGDIYKQTNGTGSFVGLGQAGRAWYGMCTLGNDVYACVNYGDIYKQTNGAGDFLSLGQISRAWIAMATLGNDVYACVNGGDIYKQTNGTGNFVALNQTTRDWSGMTTLGNDVYACVYGGDIYKQTGGTGNFVALGQTERSWNGMYGDGQYVYAHSSTGEIYKGVDTTINGTIDFVGLGLTSHPWSNMAGIGTDLYLTLTTPYSNLHKLNTLINELSTIGNNPKTLTACYSDNTALYFGESQGAIYKTLPTIQDNINFGASVKINSNGDVIAVGCPHYNNGSTLSSGAVYIYKYNIITWPDIGEWVRTHIIEPTTPVANDRFGSTVTHGPNDSLAVGHGTDLGKVAIYTTGNNIWTLSQTLQGDHVTYTGLIDGYGALPGTVCFGDWSARLFISACFTEIGGNQNTGVVYVYKHNGTAYVLETRFTGPSGPNAFFGHSISCNYYGTKLLIGCPGLGKVYLYEYNEALGTWGTPTEFVRDGDPLLNDYYGTNVAINSTGTRLYIYAHNGDLLDNCVCDEYQYINNTWVYTAQYKPNEMTGVPSDPSFPLQWNNRVQCSGDTEISDHLFVGYPEQPVLGYLEIGNVTQFK